MNINKLPISVMKLSMHSTQSLMKMIVNNYQTPNIKKYNCFYFATDISKKHAQYKSYALSKL